MKKLAPTLYYTMIRALHVKHFHAVKNNVFISSIEYLREQSTKDKFHRIKLAFRNRTTFRTIIQTIVCGPVPSVMAAGGALCSTPQSLADAHCRAVTPPRRETCWNLQGCPKLPDRSQPLVSHSSPYCEDIWRRYCEFLASFCVLYFQPAACSTFQTCILNSH